MTTRRVLSIVTVLFLTIALVPLPAFAKAGGNGGGKGDGNGKSNGAHQSSGSVTGRNKVKGTGHGLTERAGSSESLVETDETPRLKATPGKAKHRSVVPSSSMDPSATPKLHGIENALSRIQRNLARMQAQVDAGKRTSLPSGLLSVAAKFMAWLGITPAPSPTPAPTPEPTGTVEPTVTVLPTITVEPTVPVLPTTP